MTQVTTLSLVDYLSSRDDYSLLLNMTKRFETVVAHYDEDLTWVSENPSEVTIYWKGNPPPAYFKNSHRLPNIGREGHTILYHIVNRYNSLASTTLFLQGDIYDWNEGTPPHTNLTLSQLKEKSIALTGSSAIGFGVSGVFKNWDGIPWHDDPKNWLERRGKGMQMSNLTPGEFWRFIFGTDHPDNIQWTCAAIFAVRREAVRRRPLDFWTKLLDYFENLNHPNPEEGHFLERFWESIFSPEKLIAPMKSIENDTDYGYAE